MLIWRSKGREKQLSQGQFFCPKCNDLRPYQQKRVSKMFTLYFIPYGLTPVDAKAKLIEMGYPQAAANQIIEMA